MHQGVIIKVGIHTIYDIDYIACLCLLGHMIGHHVSLLLPNLCEEYFDLCIRRFCFLSRNLIRVNSIKTNMLSNY